MLPTTVWSQIIPFGDLIAPFSIQCIEKMSNLCECVLLLTDDVFQMPEGRECIVIPNAGEKLQVEGLQDAAHHFGEDAYRLDDALWILSCILYLSKLTHLSGIFADIPMEEAKIVPIFKEYSRIPTLAYLR